MASAAAIKAGEAFVKVWVNDTGVDATLSGLQKRVKSFTDEVSAVGRGLMLTGLAAGVPFVQAMRTFSGFSDKMSAVRAIVGATSEEFESLVYAARQLAGAFKPTEIAEGMLELGRAGFHTNEVLMAIPGTLDLARAGAINLGESTAILANTLRSFGLAANQTDRVGDILAKTANMSTTDIKGIGDAMKHVASSAYLSGQSIERVSAALAVLANRGLQGELAGTALARTLVKLADAPTRKEIKMQYGVETVNADGDLRDMLDIIRDLNKATHNMGNAESLALFKDLFDMRGMKGAINLAENVDEWEKFTQDLKNSEGVAADVARIMEDNLGGSFRYVVAGAENLKIALGEVMDSGLRDWAKSLKSGADAARVFIDTHQSMIVGLVKLGGTITVAGAAMYGLSKGAAAVGAIIGVVGRFSSGFKALHDRLTGVTAAQQEHRTALASMEQAGGEYNALLKRQVSAQAKAESAQQRVASAEQIVLQRKKQLTQAEADHASATEQAAQRRVAAAEAEAKAIRATRRAYSARDELDWIQDRRVAQPKDAGLKQKEQAAIAKVDTRDRELAVARATFVTETKNLTRAQESMGASSRRVKSAQDALARSEGVGASARLRLTRQSRLLAHAQDEASGAAGRLNSAGYRVVESLNGVAASSARAATFIGQLGSAKVITAAGAIAMLAGSVSMLAGDGVVGKIAGTVAAMSGMVMAVSSLAGVITMLITQYGSLGAAATALAASLGGALRAMLAFLTTNPAGWAILAAAAIGGLVYWLNQTDDSAARAAASLRKIRREAEGMRNQFDSDLEGTVNRWMTRRDDSFDGQLGNGMDTRQATRQLAANKALSKRLAADMANVRENMKAQWAHNGSYGSTVLRWFVKVEQEFDEKSIADSIMGQRGSWEKLLKKHKITEQIALDIGLDPAKSWAANEEALKRYIAIYDKHIAKMRGRDADATPLERHGATMAKNKEIAEAYAKALEEVEKKIERLSKKRADRERDQAFDQSLKDDPYRAVGDVQRGIEDNQNQQAALKYRIERLQRERDALLRSARPDQQQVNNVNEQLTGLFGQMSQLLDDSDLWDTFAEKAEEAMQKTWDEYRELFDRMKMLDTQRAQEQDDERFKDLVATNWVAASKEVAQAIARVNRDWDETGRSIAWNIRQANKGNMESQNHLKVLYERREGLVEKRRGLEQRQDQVKSREAEGKQSFQAARDITLDETKLKTRKAWDDLAARNPGQATAALADFIKRMEDELRMVGSFAEEAARNQNYAVAAAFEDRMKHLKDGLTDLRSMQGQSRERDAIVGEFNARAMEAMMRGGEQKPVVEEQQLVVQKEMAKHLKTLVSKAEAPTVVATD